MKEIGSEFWTESLDEKSNNTLKYFNIGKDKKFLMSGTTAIQYVLENINVDKKIIYMPNYCCENMIMPFEDNGYEIKYYNVDLINNIYEIDLDIDCGVFYAMNYFGYSVTKIDKYIKKFKEKDVIVIEDITHSLLQKKNCCKRSDFLIASLRKWFPIYTGGIAINMNGKFNVDTKNYIVDDNLVEIKKEAMYLKKMYIENKSNEKNIYLKLFQECNTKILEYKNKLMDQESLNIINSINLKKVIKQRRKNVKIIEKMLKEDKNLKILFLQKKGDCPLFVPIIVKDRDKLRKKTIENNIYCPIHWPNFNNFDNNLYNLELSLICDQRYTEDDVYEYVRKLIELEERK